MPQYALALEGLGEVRALTLDNVVHDDEARARVKIVCKSDPRIRPQVLYRIECVFADPEDDEPSKVATTYLMTGIGKKHTSNDSKYSVLSDFISTKEVRLYRCVQISLT